VGIGDASLLAIRYAPFAIRYSPFAYLCRTLARFAGAVLRWVQTQSFPQRGSR